MGSSGPPSRGTRRSRRRAKPPPIGSDYRDHIAPKDQTVAVEERRETGLLLTPLVPARSIVPKARLACDWLGRYEKGEPVATAYADLAGLIFERITA